MGDKESVTLYGALTSPYTKRVELALKAKGIVYDYVVEDLKNKSQSLLKYNPVHKKVPVLVHNGKPIVESFVILEYIDETWKNGPKLLPEDPYQRAQVRFWASFFQQQIYETVFLVMKSQGEAQEKAIKELYEYLKLLEEGMKDLFPNDSLFDGKNMGLLDILLCVTLGPYKALEEVFGVKIIDPEKNPLIFSWVNAVTKVPAVKELSPSYENMVEVLNNFRNFALKK